MDLMKVLRGLVRNEEGQDLLEYALLIALIALVCVGAVALAGTRVSQVFTNASSSVTRTSSTRPSTVRVSAWR